jgi:hypothetical protein
LDSFAPSSEEGAGEGLILRGVSGFDFGETEDEVEDIFFSFESVTVLAVLVFLDTSLNLVFPGDLLLSNFVDVEWEPAAFDAACCRNKSFTDCDLNCFLGFSIAKGNHSS